MLLPVWMSLSVLFQGSLPSCQHILYSLRKHGRQSQCHCIDSWAFVCVVTLRVGEHEPHVFGEVCWIFVQAVVKILTYIAEINWVLNNLVVVLEESVAHINRASSWDYGTYHIGDQRRLRWAAHPHSLTRAFTVCTHEVWKKTKGPTKNQTSSPTGWLCMRVWRTSLQKTKSALISWDGSIILISYNSVLWLLNYIRKQIISSFFFNSNIYPRNFENSDSDFSKPWTNKTRCHLRTGQLAWNCTFPFWSIWKSYAMYWDGDGTL